MPRLHGPRDGGNAAGGQDPVHPGDELLREVQVKTLQ
jgi:hypothetical protein